MLFSSTPWRAFRSGLGERLRFFSTPHIKPLQAPKQSIKPGPCEPRLGGDTAPSKGVTRHNLTKASGWRMPVSLEFSIRLKCRNPMAGNARTQRVASRDRCFPQ